MPDRSQPDRQDSHGSTRGSVLDPTWEDTLRAGQEAEGDAGSVDAELAVVHLLRHARQPEEIGDARLEGVLGQIDEQITPVAWWKKSWIAWMPVAAAAAVLVFVVVKPGEDQANEVAIASTPSEAAGPAGVKAEADAVAEKSMNEEAKTPAPPSAAPADGAVSSTASGGNAAALERQFSILEPKARAEIGASIETQRGSLRYGLLNSAKGGG